MIEIPAWGLIVFIGGTIVTFVGAWIKVRVDIGKIQERLSDVEEQHGKIPQIWKTINDMRVGIGKVETKLDDMKHSHANTKGSLEILVDLVNRIDKGLVKLSTRLDQFRN